MPTYANNSNNQALNELLETPIGLFYKCSCYANANLSENVGRFDGEPDGFGGAIGSMADPYYNTDNYISWFKNDEYKNAYRDYIDYIEHVYYTYSLKNIYEQNAEALTPARVSLDVVGVVRGYDIVSAAVSSELNMTMDTRLGQYANYYLSHALSTTAILNSARINTFGGKSVTLGVNGYVGLLNENASDITNKFNVNQESGLLDITLNLENSPVYDSLNYGDYTDFNQQEKWLSTLSSNQLVYLGRSLKNEDLIYSQDFTDDMQFNSYISKINTLLSDRNYILNSIGKDNFESPISDIISDWGEGGTPLNRRRYNNKGGEYKTLDTNYNLTYAESRTAENGEYISFDDAQVSGTWNKGIAHGKFESISRFANTSDLIKKTNAAFRAGSYRTLVARFHTVEDDEKQSSTVQTNISNTYGMSHGRNLLKLNPTNENGYTNPYCRVWTYHYQYNRLIDAIRPFDDGSGNTITQSDLVKQNNWGVMASRFSGKEQFGDYTDGRTRLGKYSVLNKNGMVNIAPTNDEDGEKSVKTRNCMFSIENLAWKDFREGKYGLSKEQKGPMGGRIMWFPPYDLKFSENVQVNWNNNSIIGRGEDIYTYINTARRGNLSFKILIDHPSILDYYVGRNDAGNDGDVNNVDDTDSNEQKLLRFFAGCEILTAQEPEIKLDTVGDLPSLPTAPEEQVPDVPQETVTTDSQIIFYVFYPNNYSGVDDAPTNTVSAMEYLANGIGCQLGIQSDTNRIVDIPVSMEIINDDWGGYEVGNKGVSCVDTETLSASTEQVLNGVRSGRKLTTVSDNTNEYNLTTQYVKPNNWQSTSEWYYRVDKVYQGQKLLRGNYVDNKSFGYNSARGLNNVKDKFATDEEKEVTYSFIDVYCALDSDMYNLMKDRGIVDDTAYQKLKAIFDTYKIKSITGGGMASSHGYKSSNNVLNKNRFNSVAKWLKTYSQFKSVETEFQDCIYDIGNVTSGEEKTSEVNDSNAKLYRSAKVIINYLKEDLVTLQETESNKNNSDDDTKKLKEETTVMGESGITYTLDIGTINVPKSIMDNINQQYGDDKESKDNAIKQMLIANPYQFYQYRTEEFDKQLAEWQKQARKREDIIESNNAKQSEINRYDNEYQFFKTLELTDPFLHSKISEKIRYFDPAFHSITPEGWNARLTFLQQCCRQGSTYSANENGMNTNNATNLAFGTPPICILRVGDFYNSKIIIDNISFDFEQWDLNQEGIGVQPMAVNISMSFIFLGGQDLDNPIPRLQNALSFNYYKNTSVYDNRAEMIKYDDDNNGTIELFKGVKH